ncbi:L-asparagine transporter [Duganella sacchari]|uniref:L-asparagine transporter n=1 Tax=Duganella sacchari TaxID=551987 RepID=A0A1M7R7D8_9BURK|nr:amino acid permease [Duganella sacchari]SHN42080.1 L-asparagine transporter [Duganella sacchari]
MNHNKSGFSAIVERETGLHRGLSSGQMSMIAIGGAVGTGLFLGSGFAIGFAGPSVLVSYAIGALIAMLLIGCLAEMTVAHPTSGSFGSYAEHYVGPWAGFSVRYSYWSSIVLAVGTEVTAVALYMQYWFPGTPAWLWIVLFSACLILVNAMSVNIFGNVEYLFSTIKIAAIVLFILLGAYMVYAAPETSPIGFKNYVGDRGFFPHGSSGMWAGVIVSIFSYLGIEMVAVAAGEARDPQQAITGAFRATMLRLVVFYMLTLGLMLAIVPWAAAGGGNSPFVMAMQALHIPGAAGVINFVILVAALSSMNSQLYITTRTMFSLSRAGQAPKRFGILSKRGVPVAALMLSCVGIALATVLSVLFPDGSFMLMMAISMFGAMFTWMMIFVTHYFFRRSWTREGHAPLPFRIWAFPWLTMLGAGLMLAIMVTTAFTKEFAMTLMTGLPFMLALSVMYFFWYRKR